MIAWLVQLISPGVVFTLRQSARLLAVAGDYPGVINLHGYNHTFMIASPATSNADMGRYLLNACLPPKSLLVSPGIGRPRKYQVVP